MNRMDEPMDDGVLLGVDRGHYLSMIPLAIVQIMPQCVVVKPKSDPGEARVAPRKSWRKLTPGEVEQMRHLYRVLRANLDRYDP